MTCLSGDVTVRRRLASSLWFTEVSFTTEKWYWLRRWLNEINGGLRRSLVFCLSLVKRQFR